MTSIFPVFIGVVGKRKFSKREPADNEGIARQRLSATFDYIDASFPDVSKVLLTGAASGSDLMAAEEVLGSNGSRGGRANWLVVAVLPFEEELYEQDFDAEQWKVFKRVVGDPRTRSWVLPRLTTGMDRGADLARRADATEVQKDLRRRHYEQAGLWIADTANVLIAVMPQNEIVDKIGGSARITACRRGGRPDWTAREIIQASRVLAPRPELMRPPQGYVWLIDPSAAAGGVGPPVIVLPPFEDELERQVASPKPGHLYNDGKIVERQDDADRRRYLRLSEIPLHIAQHHERSTSRVTDKSANGAQPLIGWPLFTDPVAVLSGMTNALRITASQAENTSRWVFYSITWLFLLAILSFEIYTKFYSHEARLIIVYAILFVLIVGFYLFARSKRLQAIAEDRRAVREVLRVQLAWWRAGLSNRVDFVHLQGADQDLARVRDVARSAIIWACLACKFRSSAECWPLVCGAGERPPRDRSNKAPDDWVGNQAFYFWLRKHQREYQTHIAESLSWLLFISSGCLAFLLFIVQMGGDEFKRTVEHWQTQVVSHYGKLMPLLAALVCLMGISALLWTRGFLGGMHSERNTIVQSVVLGIASALLLSFTIYLAVWHAAANPSTMIWPAAGAGLALSAFYGAFRLRKARPDSDAVLLGAAVTSLIAMILFALTVVLVAATQSHVEPADRAEYMIIVFIVFLTAMAAALRFLTEKLAIEAEALKYRDASDWFDRADALLRAIQASNWDDAARYQAQKIIKELGILALRESEAWLSARRERPLTPVM